MVFQAAQQADQAVPAAIDGIEFARDGRCLSGSVEVSALSRLADDLAEMAGQLAWTIAGRRDDEGKCWLDLGVSGQLSLRCQRCLEPMIQALDVGVHLLLVRRDEPWPEDEMAADGFDAIVAEVDMALLPLIEERRHQVWLQEIKEWETDTPYFEGCMPIEVMAERGLDTLRFGPMKPVGLDNPKTGRWPHAVVQLRQDNKQGTLWNMVGFQTKMKHGAQVELFRTIPGLEKAEFARLGGLHRNTFIRSPILLDRQLRLKSAPHIRFAGQITGCEGYVESAAVGLMAGIMAANELAGRDFAPPPETTAFGALLHHITGDAEAESYQPMNINFGLFPPPEGKVHKKERKAFMTNRARTELQRWLFFWAGWKETPFGSIDYHGWNRPQQNALRSRPPIPRTTTDYCHRGRVF